MATKAPTTARFPGAPRLSSKALYRLLFGVVAIALLVAVTSGMRSFFEPSAGGTANGRSPRERGLEARAQKTAPETPARGLLAEAPDVPATPAPRKSPVKEPKAATASDDAGPSSLKVLMAIGGMTILLVGGLFGAVRFLRRARLAPEGLKEIRLLDVLSVGPKRQVFVLRFKDHTLLLASSGDSLSLLADYAPEDLAPAAEGEVAERAAGDQVPATAPDRRPAADERPERRKAAEAEAPPAAPAPRRREPEAVATAAADGASPESRERVSTAALPKGAHRVPPAFRHLLTKALNEDVTA